MYWVVGAPPNAGLTNDVRWAVERLAYMRGRIEKLFYVLQPYWTYMPGSQEVYGFQIPAEPEPGSLAMELLKWGQQSPGHNREFVQLREMLNKVVHELAGLWTLVQNLWEDEIPTLDRLYKEGYYQGTLHPSARAPYGSALASREAESLLSDWDSLGYYLDKAPSLRPVWEAWDDSHGLDEFVEALDEFFLIQVPPQARLQPRDWKFYQ